LYLAACIPSSYFVPEQQKIEKLSAITQNKLSMPFLGHGRNVRSHQDDPLQQQSPKSEDGDCYYEYDHASGRHTLQHSKMNDQNKPKYSWKCILCNMVDVLIFAGCIAFLFFAIRYALYCLENSDGGDRRYY